MTDRIVAVDLFAGAGGLSTGIAKACEDLDLEPGTDVELHAINHWEPAITTHEANHPWAEHYHARIEELYPPDVVEPGTVTLLTGGPECTHFSNARGGKPVSDQKRASAWHVLDWIEKLQPTHVLLENVKEFRTWGPIDDDGTPSRDGTIFERWVGMLEALGYSVVYDDDVQDYGVVLNAKHYGDPQSRERLFILASREKLPTPPPRTHCERNQDLPDPRPAADIIDWSDLGSSIWTRDLENPRVTPPKVKTMQRIAEGIRRHCSDRLAPLADALETIGQDELEALRETVVPARYAEMVADAVDKPFLVRIPGGETVLSSPSVVKYYGISSVTAVTEPLDTVTADGNHHALSTPDAFCLRQQSGGVPVPVFDEPLSTVSRGGAIALATVESQPLVMPKNHRFRDHHSNPLYQPESQSFHTITSDPRAKLVTPSLIRYSHGGRTLDVTDPMPTVTTAKGGVFALASPYLCPLYNERDGQRPRTRAVDRPLMTVPMSKSPAAVATPFLVEYYGNSDTAPVDEPMPTLPANDRFALCVPEEWPWGLDVRYRMLQPDELKQAQGFPPDYEISGPAKKTRTAQIGNAVPVNLARALCRHLLADETPSLSTFGGGVQADPDVEVPPYEEVSSDD